MQEIRRINSSRRMSSAVVFENVAYLSGQIPDEGCATFEDQTQSVLTKIEKILINIGSSTDNILSATIWLSNPVYFEQFNKLWDNWIKLGAAPARACVHSLLMKPGCDVEISVTAACLA